MSALLFHYYLLSSNIIEKKKKINSNSAVIKKLLLMLSDSTIFFRLLLFLISLNLLVCVNILKMPQTKQQSWVKNEEVKSVQVFPEIQFSIVI